ncbi:MAG: hypothetical protein O3A00_09470 [Planctomycetota bacterium]|nr:hypothetical protein [Planctomycetota bacterium]
MIYVSCEFETPIGRSDYSDYVRSLRLDVSGCDDDGNRILLGRIAADQVLVGDAQAEGMPLFDVCDQDSGGLHETYVALFDEQGEFQPELDIEDPADSLIFVWRAVLHSRLRPYLQGVIETIGTLFGNHCVLGMWHRTTDLSDTELATLGFRRIAGSKLIYRLSALRSDFTDDHPCGMEVPLEFEAKKSDAAWVLAEWKKGDPRAPSR